MFETKDKHCLPERKEIKYWDGKEMLQQRDNIILCY